MTKAWEDIPHIYDIQAAEDRQTDNNANNKNAKDDDDDKKNPGIQQRWVYRGSTQTQPFLFDFPWAKENLPTDHKLGDFEDE